ncbi:MAG: DUF4160 domain-containing protein [Oligoflexia bacterium]|nr:DUF4160 domain-containing protein [Oligoflexia bacterium]
MQKNKTGRSKTPNGIHRSHCSLRIVSLGDLTLFLHYTGRPNNPQHIHVEYDDDEIVYNLAGKKVALKTIVEAKLLPKDKRILVENIITTFRKDFTSINKKGNCSHPSTFTSQPNAVS